MRNRRLLIIAGFAALCVNGGVAHAEDAPIKADPAEKFNRVGYAIYEFFDRTLIRPAALTYQKVVPRVLRNGARHMLDNIGEPGIAANDLLQGHVKAAGTATLRFATNSTFGVLGFFDMATPGGLPRHENAFDVTLGRWGVKSGPYLFIPIFGPTTVRGAIGSGINTAFDPFNFIVPHQARNFIIGRAVLNGIDLRARSDADLTALMSDATDPYATLRSVYLQNEQSKVDGEQTNLPALPDFDEDTAPAASSPPPDQKPDPTPKETSANPSQP